MARFIVTFQVLTHSARATNRISSSQYSLSTGPSLRPVTVHTAVLRGEQDLILLKMQLFYSSIDRDFRLKFP